MENRFIMGLSEVSLAEMGYEVHRSGATTLVYTSARPDLRELIPRQGAVGAPSCLSGRTGIRIIEPDLVVRPLVHGGLLRDLSGERFLFPQRSLRELEVSTYLRSHRVPTPEVLALRFIRQRGLYRITVITRLVPQAIDLLEHLHAGAGVDTASLFEATGRLIRRMHDLNVYHADCHLKNILLDSRQEPVICDLDKARRFHYLPRVAKTMNIRRFLRSCRKWQRKGRIELPADYASNLLKGYRGLG